MTGTGRVPSPAGRSVSFPDHEPTAGAFVRSLAERFGDREVAVRGDVRLTYAQLERSSAELARGLLAAGVTKGTHVGLLFPGSPDFLIHLFGIGRIGGVAVLLNTFSKARELGATLRIADVAHLHTVDRLLGNDYIERLATAVDGLADQPDPEVWSVSHPFLRRIRVWGDDVPRWAEAGDDALRSARASTPALGEDLLRSAEASVTPADPVVMIFSSGTTAAPKAVVHAHRTLISHSHNLHQFFEVLDDDVVYAAQPLFWVGGLSHTAISAMHVGARLVFEERFDPGPTLDLIEREGVTQIICWPDLAKSLADHPTFWDRPLKLRSKMSELLPVEQRPARPDLLAGSLGMSETLGPHLAEVSRSELPEGKRGSFGRSVPGMEHKLVDPDTGDGVGPGEHGEICVRGYSLMLGLHGRDRSEIFDADGWYHTGDGGWYDADGHVYFTGRIGDTIKTKGANVSPREVEVVAVTFPEILHIAVVGISHPERGQDVAAAVVCRPGYSIEPHEVTARLTAELSSYKVPKYVAVLAEDEMPWLDSQKIDRRGVAEMLAARFDQR